MTFESMRTKVVKEDKIATEKELNSTVRNLGLSIIFSSVWLGLVTISTWGMNLFVATLMCLIYMFIAVCDYAAEDEKSFNRVRKITKFWWLHLFVIAGVFVVLKFFYFI